jgi:hypothetical protein
VKKKLGTMRHIKFLLFLFVVSQSLCSQQVGGYLSGMIDQEIQLFGFQGLKVQKTGMVYHAQRMKVSNGKLSITLCNVIV